MLFRSMTSALEIFHNYGYVHSYSTETYHVIFKLGQYFTIVVLLLLVYTFDLKLRFVLSPAGNYYEKILETSPARITRWRDEIDNLILKTFSKNTKILKHIGYTAVNEEKTKELTQ